MRKHLYRFIPLALAAVFLCSCGVNNTSGCDDTKGGEQDSYIGIIEGGKTEYSIVVADGASHDVKEAALELRYGLFDMSSVNVFVKADNDSGILQKRIDIGGTSLCPHNESLTDFDYVFTVRDGNITIDGGSEWALSYAVEEFIKNYVKKDGDKIMVSDSLDVAEKVPLSVGNWVSGWNADVFGGLADVSLPYQIYIPENYSDSKEYPVILFLHGDGLRGNDNEKQISNGESTVVTRAINSKQDVIIIAPQCPSDSSWVLNTGNNSYNFDDTTMSPYLSAAIALLDKMCDRLAIDTDRIYLNGYSRGSFATWYLFCQYPTRFAAGIVAAGAGDPTRAEIIKDIPVWIFHGDKDTIVPYSNAVDMYTALVAAGGSPKFTAVTGYGHGVATGLAGERDLITWLFEQKLK